MRKDQEIIKLVEDLENIKGAIISPYLDNPFQVLSPARLSELRTHMLILKNTRVWWFRESKSESKCFNLQPTKKIGEYGRRGEQVGIAQDISKRYPPENTGAGLMHPHVHVEIENMDPAIINTIIQLFAG